MSTKPLFTDFGLDDDLTAALRERKIVHPFPIQELTLPLAFKGHDIIGQARTGTGKTLAFGLPLLQRIDTSKAQTQALVIVPTRELCIQVADDLTVGADRGVTTIAVYGGVGYDEQIEALTSGVHVVIGTPGRTIDHLNRGNLDVSRIHTVVLDEADEMLDMGFLPDVERLLADVPEQRQTLLFSATMPTAIVKLARRFMAKPTFMRADETLHETAPTVDQYFFLVHRMDKPRVLARLLQMPGRGGAFVFCRTKRMCDRLVQELDDLGVAAIAVHGDLRQSSREKNLDRFRDGKADVLVATEVAARGLDVSNVTHVVNYDCPDDEKMYLHRIGRTARAGESGVAVTFAEFNEVDRVNVIRKRVAVEDEMMEVFSTSDELTKLFDLPETTPWDELAGSGSTASSGSSRSSRSKSSKSTSSGSSSRGSGSRSRSSSGTTRSRSKGGSRARDGDSSSRRRGSAAASGGGDTGDTTRTDSGSSRSRSRTRTRSRTSTEAVVAQAQQARDDDAGGGTGDGGKADDGAGRSRSRGRGGRGDDSRDGNSKGSSRSSRSRSRGSTRDADTSSPTGGTSSRTDDTQDQGATTTPRRSTGGDDSASGGSKGSGGRKRARPRARRNRDSRSSSSSSSGRDSNGSDTNGTDAKGRDGNGASSARRSNTSRDKASNVSSAKDGSRGRGHSRDTSSRSASRTSSGTQTTRRGDDARGDGTPRPRRRVEVEHLP